MELQELIGEPGAAKLMNVKANTLRKWRQTGKGPAFIRISPRCVKYRVEDLERFLTERVVTPGAAREVRQ